MIKKLLFFCFLCSSTILLAEAPTCETKDTVDAGPWKNAFNVGFNKTSGNSDVSLLNLGFLSKYEKDNDLIRLQFDHNYGQTNNAETGVEETNVDYSYANGEYKNLLSEKAYLGVGAEFTRNEIADVKYRTLLNPKVGYFFYKQENVGSFDVYLGPSYLWEEVGGQTDDYLAPRIGNRFEYQITETAKFFETIDLIISSESSDNYLIQAEAGIETKISDDLNLVFKVRDLYDNEPALGSKKNDLALLTGISLDF